MMSRESIESVLNRLRPLLQADGGDIELIDVQGNSAQVRLLGMCCACLTGACRVEGVPGGDRSEDDGG